jgi:hypothetical protein
VGDKVFGERLHTTALSRMTTSSTSTTSERTTTNDYFLYVNDKRTNNYFLYVNYERTTTSPTTGLDCDPLPASAVYGYTD